MHKESWFLAPWIAIRYSSENLMAKFGIPITIPIAYVQAGRRKEEFVYEQGWMSVEFRRVDPGATELVARISQRDGDFGVSKRLADKDGLLEHELRWFENSHWISIGSEQDIQRQIQAGDPGRTALDQTRFYNADRAKDPPFNYIDFRRKVGLLRIFEKRDEALKEKVLNVMSNMVVVDGQVFERIQEPHLTVKQIYSPFTLAITINGFDGNYSTIDSLPLWARADRLDQLDRLQGSLQEAGVEHLVRCSVEVLKPELLFTTPGRELAVDTMNDVLHDLTKKAHMLPQHAAAAMLELRDAVRVSPRHLGTRQCRALQVLADLPETDPDWLSMMEERASRYGGMHNETSAVREIPGLLTAARESARQILAVTKMDKDRSWDFEIDQAAVVHPGGFRTSVVTGKEWAAKVARWCNLDASAVIARLDAGDTLLAVETAFGWRHHRPIWAAALVSDGAVEVLKIEEGEHAEALLQIIETAPDDLGLRRAPDLVI